MSELPPEPPPSSPPPTGPALPWEEPSAGLGSIVPTAVRLITSPIESFRMMSLTVDLVRPIAYFVAFTLVGAVLGQIWNVVFHDAVVEMLRRALGPRLDPFASLIQRPGVAQIVVGLILTPLVMIVLLFVWTALVHVMLVILGGARSGFAATLRVVCYAETSQIAAVVPFVGGLVALFWRLILQMIGLSEAHRTDAWKAVVAVLAPLLLCCLCGSMAIVMFGAAMAQALQNAR